MSTIGSGSLAGLNFAGSIVGSSRVDSAADRNKAASAEQKASLDRDAILEQTLGDVTDAEFTPERDADGRLLYHRQPNDAPGTPAESPASETVVGSHCPAPDAFGDCGNVLDVEA